MEIVELARALKYDPDLIYEHIYNNIETLPQYGSLKGPLGTLLDGKGTAFDQAELMVALLRESGINASFQLGQIDLDSTQLITWLGTDLSYNSVASALGAGGFSGSIADIFGIVIAARIGWAWVRVELGSALYFYDPATKAHTRTNPIGNLATAMGYTRSTFTSNALSGATVTSTSITGLNRTNLRADLTHHASSLVQYLRSTTPAAATTEVIGGKTIVPLPLGTKQRRTSYGLGGIGYASLPSWSRTTLSLTLGYNDASNNFVALASPVTSNTADVYGRRMVVAFDGSSIASLLVDGIVQSTASGVPPGGRRLTIRTSIDHPYPTSSSDVTNSDRLKVAPQAGFIYAIANAWGPTGRGMIEKHRRLLQQNAAQNPSNPSAEPVLGESLAMLGYTWAAEISRQQDIVEQLGGVQIVRDHVLGIVGMRAVGSSVGPFVDFPLNLIAVTQRAGRPNLSPTFTSLESAAFIASGIFAGSAESGVIEQTQPGTPAISTVKFIDMAVQSGGQIFDINNSAVAGDDAAYYTSTIRPILATGATAYSASDLAAIDNFVYQQGFRVIAPANGALVVGLLPPSAGFFAVSQTGGAIAGVISGGLFGGAAGFPVPPVDFNPNIEVNVERPTIDTFLDTTVLQSVGNATDYNFAFGRDPINLVTGDYVYDTTDLAIGSLDIPYGLSFQRHYDSGTRERDGPLGLGWTHNFAITAAPDSDPFEGLAANSPINGAVAIVATYVMLDLLNTGANIKPLDRMLMVTLAQRWLTERLTGNVVSINRPGMVERFTKLSDDSYNPPLGSGANLALVAGGYQYKAKDGVTLGFNSNGNVASWTSPAGPTMALSYGGVSPEVLVSVANDFGRTLSFTYDGSSRLTKVTDSAGRMVSYSYDSTGSLTSATDPLGNVTRYVYALPGQLAQIFKPAFPDTALVTNTYDALGRVKTQANANNSPTNNTTWHYFLAGTRSEEVDPYGVRRVTYATSRGSTRAEIQDLDGLNLVTISTYDGLDRLASRRLPEGNRLIYVYDLKSNVVSITAIAKPGSPLASLTTNYEYDITYNKPVKIDAPCCDPGAPGRQITRLNYDPATGNLVAMIRDAGAAPHLNATSRFTYTAKGQVLTAIDPLGVVTRFGYDANGNQVTVLRDEGGANLLTTAGYDVVGNAISVTDPNGNVTRAAHNADRWQTSVSAPLASGLVTVFAHDADGRVIETRQSVAGTLLRAASATYTPTGQVVSATDANGNVTRSRYDLMDRLVQLRDPAGRITDFQYDGLGRRSAVLNTAIQALPLERRSYTPNSQLATLTDAIGTVTSYSYDGFDRADRTTYADASYEQNGYDLGGNLLTRRTRAGDTIAFAYDTLNRLTTKTPPSPAPVVSYRYDLTGRLTGVSDTSAAIASIAPPTGVASVAYQMSYSYDAVNRVATTRRTG